MQANKRREKKKTQVKRTQTKSSQMKCVEKMWKKYTTSKSKQTENKVRFFNYILRPFRICPFSLCDANESHRTIVSSLVNIQLTAISIVFVIGSIITSLLAKRLWDYEIAEIRNIHELCIACSSSLIKFPRILTHKLVCAARRLQREDKKRTENAKRETARELQKKQLFFCRVNKTNVTRMSVRCARAIKSRKCQVFGGGHCEKKKTELKIK